LPAITLVPPSKQGFSSKWQYVQKVYKGLVQEEEKE